MSDPIIRPAGNNDVDAICHLLHTKMDKKISPNRWRKLMQYEWMTDKPDFGRVVDYGGEILGYLGMVYADRQINQKIMTSASLSGWYLDKSMRGYGLGKALMVDVITDQSVIYTMITVSSKVVKLVEDLGYKTLDEHRYVWRKNSNSKQLTLLTCPEEILARVPAKEKKILLDHASLPVMPVLIEDHQGQSLFYFSIKKKAAGVLYYDVLYTNNRTFLSSHGQQLANVLLTQQPSVLAADCRFVDGPAIGAQREQLSVPRYYKATSIAAKDVDYLYSELLLLDLKLD